MILSLSLSTMIVRRIDNNYHEDDKYKDKFSCAQVVKPVTDQTSMSARDSIIKGRFIGY